MNIDTNSLIELGLTNVAPAEVVDELAYDKGELGSAVSKLMKERREERVEEAAESVVNLLESVQDEGKDRADSVRHLKQEIERHKKFGAEMTRLLAWGRATNNYLPLGNLLGAVSYSMRDEFEELSNAVPKDWKAGDSLPEKWATKDAD